MNSLLAPFAYPHMINAMLAATLTGTLCALLSCFLILKRWALVGDALSHAVVPGVAVAYLLGLPFAVGAFFTGFLAAGAMLALNRIPQLKQDAVIAFVFSAFFAGGLFLISLKPIPINLYAVIYGNLLAVSNSELWQILTICILTLLLFLLKWRDFFLLFFDETQAVAAGLRCQRLKILFFALLSAAVVASLQTVGAILVIALVITPGATAALICERFSRILLCATAIGAATALLGTYLSYFFDTLTGALIVLMQGGLFLLAFCFSRKNGILRRSRVLS